MSEECKLPTSLYGLMKLIGDDPVREGIREESCIRANTYCAYRYRQLINETTWNN